MMKITLALFVVCAALVGLGSPRDIPQNITKPDSTLEYEIISPTQVKPLALPQPKPINDDPQSGNKTFIYEPATRTWTPVKSTDPEAKEGTLLWNQNNDKWLTQSFWP